MSILIKGMEMPESCWDCPIQVNPFCVLDLIELTDTEKRIRPENCPLVEIPPHGRLIDADELLNAIKKAWEDDSEIADVYKEDYAAVSDWLYTAPTVIPADKDGEE